MNDTLLTSVQRVAGRSSGIMDADIICTPSSTIEKLTVIITPEVARRLMEQTDLSLQRRKSTPTVRAYAADMAEGRWAHNHAVIQQDVNGNIIDGQHRLLACIMSDRPFVTDMVKGVVYADVMDTIDTGKNRSKADILSMAVSGIKHQATIAGAIDFIYNFSRGRYTMSQNHADRFSNHQIREWASANPQEIYQLAEAAKEAHKMKNNLLPHKMAVGFRYIFGKINPRKADDFFNQLLYGINLTPASPVFFIRERMQNAKASRSRIHRLTYRDYMLLMIKAWNDVYDNDGVMSVKFYKTSDVELPELAGLQDAKLYNLPKSWK